MYEEFSFLFSGKTKKCKMHAWHSCETWVQFLTLQNLIKQNKKEKRATIKLCLTYFAKFCN